MRLSMKTETSTGLKTPLAARHPLATHTGERRNVDEMTGRTAVLKKPTEGRGNSRPPAPQVWHFSSLKGTTKARTLHVMGLWLPLDPESVLACSQQRPAREVQNEQARQPPAQAG
jgi:hypothetical protein